MKTGSLFLARILPCILSAFIMTSAGCSDISDSVEQYVKDPSAEPIKAVVRTSVPLAYAASVAMATVAGTPPSNAAVLYNSCSTSPSDCAAAMTISADDSASPLQFASYGTITVFGYWTSPDQAILTVSFSGDAGSSLFPVHHISLFPVIRTMTGFRIVYVRADIDVSAGPIDPATLTPAQIDLALVKLNTTSSSEPSANVNMDAWIIDAANEGTQTFSDDTYSISGGGQYIETSSGSASVLQLGMAFVSMGPGCALNPVSGLAALNEVAAGSSSNTVLATALISFGSACDGNAHVEAATGNYLLSNGKSIPLNLTL